MSRDLMRRLQAERWTWEKTHAELGAPLETIETAAHRALIYPVGSDPFALTPGATFNLLYIQFRADRTVAPAQLRAE
jgi:hypothetical protein